MAAQSTTGLNKNVAAALSYVLGPVTGIVFFILEKDPYVKFHTMQSIVVFLGLLVLQWGMGITLILLPLVPFVGIISFILWLILIYKAWQGEEWEVPVFGKFTRQILSRS